MAPQVTTADIVIHGTESTQIPDESVHVRYCLRITFAVGQVIWIPSHDDVIPLLPNGASYTIHARIAEGDMPDIARNAGLTSGTSTISTPTYRVVDIDNELSDLIANKNINGVGTHNASITEFEFEAGDDNFDAKMPKYTGVIHGHTKPFDTIRFETADINAELDTEVMEPKMWRLMDNITEEQPTIPTTLNVLDLPDNQFLFQHTSGYLANPGEMVGYAQIVTTGEIFSYTAFEDVGGVSTFTGVDRHVLGSQGSAVTEITAGMENQEKPDIMEWILLDETATTMIKGMITGFMGARPMPRHWSANASTNSIDEFALARHSTAFKLQFQNYGKTSCRGFYESEILAPMRAAMVTDGWGRLNWTQRVLPVDANAGAIVLDKTNCVTTNEIELRHINTDIYPSVKLNTDWNPFAEKFLSQVTYQDQGSASHNKLSVDRTKEYSFKGIHLGIHTEPQIRRLAATFGDDHFYETLGLTLESYVNNIPLGTLITVRFDDVRDDAMDSAASGPLLRTMMVTEANERRGTRTTVYELSGSMYVQSARQAGNSLHNMSAAEYRRGKINLATLPGISITSGIASGNITLRNGAEYYYVDAGETGEGLEFGTNLNVTISGNGPSVKLFIFGPFVNRTLLDLTGRSPHRVGIGGTESTPATVGESGYAMSSRSTGAVNTERLYGSLLSSDRYYYPPRGFKGVGGSRGISTPGLNARAPDVLLDLNDGVLGGVPDDLSGTAGPGGPASRHYDAGKRPTGPSSDPNWDFVPTTRWLNGTNGGQGGGGLVIVSWSGGNATGGTIILSGGAAGLTVSQLTIGPATVRGSRGGGGGPGTLLWIVDGGAHSPPQISASDVLAYHGESTVSGTQLMPFETVSNTSSGTYRSHVEGTPRANQFESCSRVVYTPFVGRIQSRTGNEVDLFFQNQRDGRVDLIIQDFRPSNANVGDMWMTTTAFQDGSDRPNAEVLDNNGWRRLDWDTDNVVYQFLYVSARDYSGNTVYFGTTRPTDFDDGDLWRDPNQDVTWILHTTGEDEILTRSGVQVGDERLTDPNFVQTATAGAPYTRYWYITSDRLVLPTLTVAAKGSTGDGFALQPPFNLRVAVYGGTAAELFWDRPSDMTGINSFDVYINGTMVDNTVNNTADSFFHQGLIAGNTYTFGVRSVGVLEYSAIQSETAIMAPETLDLPSILSVTVTGGSKLGTAPTGTDGRPTMTLDSAGPTIVLNTTNVEDTRQVWISFSGGATASVVVSGNVMSYTPGVPADFAGQQFSAYVANEAGQAVSLSNIAYVSSEGSPKVSTGPATANPSGPPQLLTPVDGAIIYGTTHLFEFVPNSVTVQDWIIRLGTDSGSMTNYLDWRANTGAATSVDVTTLPANGSSVYCQFSWKEFGVWTSVVSTFTSAAS